MILKKLAFPLTAVLLMITSAGCARNAFGPLPAGKLSVKDGETLVYGLYKDGEKTYEQKLVARLYPESNILVMYIHGLVLKEHKQYPEYYTNFDTRIVISLKDASMISYYFNNLTDAGENKSDFPDYLNIAIDRPGKTATIVEKKWNGHEIRTITSRMPIKPEYSTWDMNSLGFIGARFLDLNGKGVVYAIVPEIIKEPVLCSFQNLGKETVTVNAGKFNTVKFGFTLSDPFLSSLMSQYTKVFLEWKEDNERGLIIKLSSPWGVSVLEEEGIWKDPLSGSFK